MPRAWDRRTPRADHDPLVNKLDFDDPSSQISDSAFAGGQKIRSGLPQALKDTTGVDLFHPQDWALDFGWLQNTWDAVVQAFTNGSQTGNALSDMFTSMSQQKRETTEIAAAVQQLQADRNAQFVSGKSAVITVSDFVGIPTPFTLFSDTGAGSITNDGDTLEFSNDTGQELYVYNEELQTDFFEVSVIAPRQAGTYFGSYGNRYIYLLARANDPVNPTTFVFMRLGGNKVRVGAVKAGSAYTSVATPFWFGPDVTYPWGSYLTFRGGIIGEERAFQLSVNNNVRSSTFTDPTDFSLFGLGYRFTGWGLENEANDSINRVPNISHVAINDNAPPPTIGVGCKLFRANPSGAALAGATAGTNYEMDGCYDSIEYNTATHFTVIDLPKGLIQINQDGHYEIDFRSESPGILLSVNVSNPPHFLTPYIRNGSVDGPRGVPASSARDGFANLLGVNAMNLTRSMYLYAGDVISIRFTIGSTLVATSWAGDTLGTKTFLILTLLNWSTS